MTEVEVSSVGKAWAEPLERAGTQTPAETISDGRWLTIAGQPREAADRGLTKTHRRASAAVLEGIPDMKNPPRTAPRNTSNALFLESRGTALLWASDPHAQRI